MDEEWQKRRREPRFDTFGEPMKAPSPALAPDEEVSRQLNLASGAETEIASVAASATASEPEAEHEKGEQLASFVRC